MYKTFFISLITINFSISCFAVIASPKAEDKMPQNRTKLSEKVYLKAYSVMKYSRIFHNRTYEEIKTFIDDIEDWESPAYITQRFPYYHAGYDFDDKPIWVCEYGKYHWNDILNRNATELMIITEKLVIKAVINVFKSLVEKDTEAGVIHRQVMLVFDCEGFNMRNLKTFLAHPEFLEFIIRKFDEYLDILVALIGEILLINANYAMSKYVDIIRPIVGELMERVTVLGVNKYKWKAELRRLIPENSIPPWYGGSKDFKPLAVY